MKRIRWGQLVVIMVVASISLWSIWYNFSKDQVKYGLDLKGGVHLVLEAEPIKTTEVSAGEEQVVEETTETPSEDNVAENEPVNEETESIELDAAGLKNKAVEISEKVNELLSRIGEIQVGG